jgi:hypothetical protein
MTALNQAESAFGRTDMLRAARAHIQSGKRYAASANVSIEDDPVPRLKVALWDFRQLDHQRQAEVFRRTSDPFESLVTDHIRAAGESVTSLVPMTTLELHLWEDDLSALFRVLLAASVEYLGWTIPDQSQGGYSAKGNAGRRDLLVQKTGTTLAVIEAVMCRYPTTQQSTRDDLTKHFRKLFGYSQYALFFHLTYAFIDNPASILECLKRTAERDAPSGFMCVGREDIPATDPRPVGFVAHYTGALGPIKVVFLILDMFQHAQKEAAKAAGETNLH